MALNIGQLNAKITVDLTQFMQAMRTARQSFLTLSATARTSAQQIRTSLNGVNTAAQNTSGNLNDLTNQLNNNSQSANNASSSFEDLISNFGGIGGRIGGLIGTIRGIGGALSGMGGAAGGAGAAAGGLGASMGAAGAAIAAVAAPIAIAVVAIGTITLAATAATAAIIKLYKEVITLGMELNTNKEMKFIAFETILGDGEKARVMLKEISEFAKTTPFESSGLQSLAVKLVNAGVPAGELFKLFEGIGNAASASGQDVQEVMEAVSINITQAMGRGKFTIDELNETGARGIPVWRALELQFGKSTKEIQNMINDGDLLATDVIPALAEGLNKLRPDAMNRISKTWSGMVGTLKDEWKTFITDITGPSYKLFTSALMSLLGWFEKFKESGRFDALKKNITTVLTDMSKVVIYIGTYVIPLVIEKFAQFFGWLGSNWETIKTYIVTVYNTFSQLWGEYAPPILSSISTAFRGFGNIVIWIMEKATALHDAWQIVFPFLQAGADMIEGTYREVGLNIKSFFIGILDWVATAVEALPLDNLALMSKLIPGVDWKFIEILADMKETTTQWKKDIKKELSTVDDSMWKPWVDASIEAAKKINEIKKRKKDKPDEPEEYKYKTFEDIFGKDTWEALKPPPSGTGGAAGGDKGKTLAEKNREAWEATKAEIAHQKAMDRLTISAERAIYAQKLSLYNNDIKIKREISELIHAIDKKTLADRRAALKEQLDEEKSNISKRRNLGIISANQEVYLLEQHYAKIKARQAELGNEYTEVVTKALNDLQTARSNLITKALDSEWLEIEKKLRDRNTKELDAVNEFYDKKLKAIDEAIKKEKGLYEEQDVTEKRAELEKERRFLAKSFDKDAIRRVKEIDKELRQLDRDEKLKQMEEQAEVNKKNLEEQRKIAIEVQSKINQDRIETETAKWDATRMAFQKSAANITEDIFGLIKSVESKSDTIERAGVNFVQRLVDGFNSVKPDLEKTVSELAELLDIRTKLGEFKADGKLFTDVSLARMSNPLEDKKVNNSYAFNAPILSVNSLVLGDTLDVKTVASEMWSAVQNVARADGATILGRG